MNKLMGLILLIIMSESPRAQNSIMAEKAFRSVINEGLSTAPKIIVVQINNLNTGVSKEICKDMSSFFWAIQRENNELDFNKLNIYLLSKSSDRTFDLKNNYALDRINFNDYLLSNSKEIESIIENGHLVDSLKKLENFNLIVGKQLDDYRDKREDLLDEISDSIKKVRPLTSEEHKMINDLGDRYYDNYYTKPIYDKNRKVSEQGKKLMRIWTSKIKNYSTKISEVEAESKRMYNKFFQQYYKIYGLGFCHVAFTYGIITCFGDENPVVGFSEVVK
jgi:hypothetical protein